MKFMIQRVRKHLGMFLTAISFLAIEAMMLGVALLGALGAVMRNIYASRTSQLIGKEPRSDLYKKVQTLSFEDIDRLKPASLITRITNDVTQIQNFINGCMRIMVKAPITCIGAIALIIIQTPGLVPIMTVILTIAAIPVQAYRLCE